MTHDEPPQKHTQGISLAKGPVGLLGLAAVIYGISALILGGHGFGTQHVPHAAVHGQTWLGLEVNGWSDLLFIAAGLLLLFAAPLHWGAKGMSLVVGVVLAAAAVTALIRGNGVFGLFAANGLTELVWGAGGALLLLLSWLPRVGAKATAQEQVDVTPRRKPSRVKRPTATVAREPASTHTRWLEDAEEQDRPPSTGARRTDNQQTR